MPKQLLKTDEQLLQERAQLLQNMLESRCEELKFLQGDSENSEFISNNIWNCLDANSKQLNPKHKKQQKQKHTDTTLKTAREQTPSNNASYTTATVPKHAWIAS